MADEFVTREEFKAVTARIHEDMKNITNEIAAGFERLTGDMNNSKVQSAGWRHDIHAEISAHDDKKQGANRAVVSMAITVLGGLFAAGWWSIQASNNSVRQDVTIDRLNAVIAIEKEIAGERNRLTALTPLVTANKDFVDWYAARLRKQHAEVSRR